ncbi:hypothetical protein [Olleya sp. R77988]|uniref:hypothetical protein n=1 Tax=Olleya sp. R77988 TaxID=3093875 RepID=UPI0037C9459E
MKHLILKTKYVVLALLVSFCFSCSTEDGADGPAEPAGANGIDGADGNANVQNITFDASAFAGTFDSVTITQLTQDVLENDAILTYLNTGSNWFPVPCPADSIGFDHAVDVTYSVGAIDFDYIDSSGSSASITAGDLVSGRVIIIESTSTTASRVNTTQKVFMELNAAGIDINDYEAVCNYYGIAY